MWEGWEWKNHTRGVKVCDIKKMMLKQIRDEKYTAEGKDQIC